MDRNGCDTRNDILRRDLADVVFTEGSTCKITGGHFQEPYTGQAVDFRRGSETSSAVQIDHVVAFGDAWQKGAQRLTPKERQSLANDPLNLIAVDGQANQKKSAGDAATWLPANKGFRCHYVARQISVKAAYRLWVTAAEKDAMKRVLESCPASGPSGRRSQLRPRGGRFRPGCSVLREAPGGRVQVARPRRRRSSPAPPAEARSRGGADRGFPCRAAGK